MTAADKQKIVRGVCLVLLLSVLTNFRSFTFSDCELTWPVASTAERSHTIVHTCPEINATCIKLVSQGNVCVCSVGVQSWCVHTELCLCLVIRLCEMSENCL